MDAETLWRLVGGTEVPPFELARGYAATRRIAGFNGVPRLPRSEDIALAAGSTWRFSWTTDDQEAIAGARDLLEKATAKGLGLRRGEGYGRILVDLPLQTIGLEQTRNNAPYTLETVTGTYAFALSASARQAPLAAAPPKQDKTADKVPREDRIGVARLLQRVVQGSISIEAILEGRDNNREGKSDKGTESFLKKTKGQGPTQLMGYAQRLIELDAEERSKREKR
jgi:hypothetical protein